MNIDDGGAESWMWEVDEVVAEWRSEKRNVDARDGRRSAV
jgi:hypothetical protein